MIFFQRSSGTIVHKPHKTTAMAVIHEFNDKDKLTHSTEYKRDPMKVVGFKRSSNGGRMGFTAQFAYN